jgi:hypothetical protein
VGLHYTIRRAIRSPTKIELAVQICPVMTGQIRTIKSILRMLLLV